MCSHDADPLRRGPRRATTAGGRTPRLQSASNAGRVSGFVVASARAVRRDHDDGQGRALLVAGSFIVFSLVVAMVVPRRPTFPGRRWAVHAVALTARCSQRSSLPSGGWPRRRRSRRRSTAEPTETETEPTETEPRDRDDRDRDARRRLSRPAKPETERGRDRDGRRRAARPRRARPCSRRPAAAAATRSLTPEPPARSGRTSMPRSPSFDKVVERVTNGKAPMPSFKGQLSEQQIRDVAAYVSESTRLVPVTSFACSSRRPGRGPPGARSGSAEREGFEPSTHLCGYVRDFQSRSFGRSDTSPGPGQGSRVAPRPDRDGDDGAERRGGI